MICREFLAELWPVDDTSRGVTGERLSTMYHKLHEGEARKSKTNGT